MRLYHKKALLGVDIFASSLLTFCHDSFYDYKIKITWSFHRVFSLL